MELYQALITLDGWTFLAQICNLMIQLVIFKKFLLKPIKQVIADRKAKADSEIADAQKLRTEAEAMKAEYEQNLQNARTEANQIVATAQKTATARSEEIVGEARAQAAALKQKAEADIAQERKKAVNEVKDEIGGNDFTDDTWSDCGKQRNICRIKGCGYWRSGCCDSGMYPSVMHFSYASCKALYSLQKNGFVTGNIRNASSGSCCTYSFSRCFYSSYSFLAGRYDFDSEDTD